MTNDIRNLEVGNITHWFRLLPGQLALLHVERENSGLILYLQPLECRLVTYLVSHQSIIPSGIHKFAHPEFPRICLTRCKLGNFAQVAIGHHSSDSLAYWYSSTST